MTLDMNTIQAMASSGITFVVNIRAMGGGRSVILKAADVPAYIANIDQFAADQYNVSKDEYLAWIDCEGIPQCGATTEKGTRCKNNVSGGMQRSISDWLDLDGGLCAVHGGQSADDARLERFEKLIPLLNHHQVKSCVPPFENARYINDVCPPQMAFEDHLKVSQIASKSSIFEISRYIGK